MDKHIETKVKYLEWKIRILENLDNIIEEFNMIPDHKIKFRVQEHGGEYFIYFDKLTDIKVIKRINEIVLAKTHKYDNYGYKDSWKFCRFDKTSSVYRLFLHEDGRHSPSKSTLVTLDNTDCLYDFIDCLKKYIEEFKSNLLTQHIEASK